MIGNVAQMVEAEVSKTSCCRFESGRSHWFRGLEQWSSSVEFGSTNQGSIPWPPIGDK